MIKPNEDGKRMKEEEWRAQQKMKSSNGRGRRHHQSSLSHAPQLLNENSNILLNKKETLCPPSSPPYQYSH